MGADQLLAVLTLTLLEIVLGIDNIIFITLLVNKLPEILRKKARTIGLSLAMCTRIALLCSLSWMASLTNPIYPPLFDFSARDLILIIGGGFLIYKALIELLSKNQDAEKNTQDLPITSSMYSKIFWFTMGQIALIDIVFSLDSVITAVGLVNEIPIMVLAIILSVFIMMFALKPISDFLDTHPSYKMLALYFLILVGAILILEGFDLSMPKSYLYIGLAILIFVKNSKKLFFGKIFSR